MSVDYYGTSVDDETVYKNSGILRYAFGDIGSGGSGSALLANQAAIAGGDGFVCYCLGDDALTNPDSDNQLFGMTPGHAAITAATGSIFHGLAANGAVAQKNGVPIGAGAGVRFPPNSPGSGTATGQGRIAANGRVPAGTKVIAWWQSYEATPGASTVDGDDAVPKVQTEIKQNRFYTSGVQDSSGQSFISSIRVAVANDGPAASSMQGVLFVWVLSSVLDIPGGSAQDQMFPFAT